MMRLDRFLCEKGIGTRSEVKSVLKKGLVTVNGVIVKKPEQKIDETADEICFQGQKLIYHQMEYFLLNKPAGCVTATRDSLSETVMSFLPEGCRKDLFPVGRLDKDTEGLLLITNDGPLAHQLLSPKKHVDKTYFAVVDGTVTEEHVQLFREGVDIGDETRTMPADLKILKSGDISEIELTIREGRYHQVKRMFEAVGGRVMYLKRLSMGSLTLGNLKPGEVRVLDEKEVDAFRNTGA
ncbi:MAG: pseudouridine synthase [Lachnospiraceae bacterium]